jgi:nucleotide-binding universal stress UspA family protein
VSRQNKEIGMKVILSADGTDEGAAARQWCAANLHAGDSVIAVVGVNQFGEFVLGVPPFDALGGEPELLAGVKGEYCRPLTEIGLACDARLLRDSQRRAVIEVAETERADLIVIGKRPHGWIADLVLGEVIGQVVHHPPCPVLLVPTETHASRAVSRR